MGNLEKNIALNAENRADFALIAKWISPNAKVLDLGCGDGALQGYVPFSVFCGHNFSFDMLYLFRTDPELKKIIQDSKIWDTQIAEYILSGQRTKFSSLNELAKKYGYPMKDEAVTEYFKGGLGSEKVPTELLLHYLKHDVEVTWKIARDQHALAIKQGQLVLIKSQMEALQATAEMMFNGLHIDKEALDKYTVEVVNEYVEVKLTLEELSVGLLDDINSPKQWSQYFFGGKNKVMVKTEIGTYKNGNTKYKLMEKVVTLLPAVAYTPDPEKVSAKTKQVSVDDSVLNDMLDHTFDPKVKTVIKALLKYRELSKQLSTYVQGLSKHLIGDYIHGKLNQTATVTGRLSSTSPNLQNISNNPIKQIFTSRHEGGYIVEVDFNQLEVVALAHITNDKQLIADIAGGADIHSELYKDMYGKYPTKEERKPFKSLTFGLVYGAGAKTLAKNSGRSLEEGKKFVDTFYKRYPDVAKWHTDFAHIVDITAKHLRDSEGSLERFRTCVHTTETGRRFVFTEYKTDSKWASSDYSFSPTELKNYKVQGLATGDIVPHMLGIIFRAFRHREGVLLLNTIHDSVLFDVTAEALIEFILDIQEVFQATHTHFETTFKHPLALKLNAGVSYGINWYSMKEVE